MIFRATSRWNHTSANRKGSFNVVYLTPMRYSIWLTTIKYDDPMVSASTKLSDRYFDMKPAFNKPRSICKLKRIQVMLTVWNVVLMRNTNLHCSREKRKTHGDHYFGLGGVIRQIIMLNCVIDSMMMMVMTMCFRVQNSVIMFDTIGDHQRYDTVCSQR